MQPTEDPLRRQPRRRKGKLGAKERMAEAKITTVELRTRVIFRPYRSIKKPVRRLPTICIGELRLTGAES